MKKTVSAKELREHDGLALGRQMTVEFFDCDSGILTDAAAMEKIFIDSAKQSGATVIDSRFHQFFPQGVSGVVIISESHFAVHAWPEHEYAAVDLFTCGDSIDFNKAVEVIASGIGCREWVISGLVNRGIVGNNGVERVVPMVGNSDCQKFQLSWKTRYEQTCAGGISCLVDIYGCKASYWNEKGFVKRFIKEFSEKNRLKCSGELLQNDNCEWCDFVQLLENGRITGSVRNDQRSVCLDIFVKTFIDPRQTAENAVSVLDGSYYRMQAQVRNQAI